MPPTTKPIQFLKSQFTKVPYPVKNFIGQTIIVTGSNVGMGLEAARYFVRLDAEKVILAVRTEAKGDAAKSSIEASEKRHGVVEVWKLDLLSYASVKDFAMKAQGLKRLDIVVANAGIYTFDFATAEENERTITVNVISTFLLALMLIPKLRETAIEHEKVPVLTFTGSFVHAETGFPERMAENILEELAKGKTARMKDRYNVSKLIELLCVRELAKHLTKSTQKGAIIASITNPGFVDTTIMREAGFIYSVYLFIMKKTISRTAEEGGRILVSAAAGGIETHGVYLEDCKVGKVSPFVSSEEGKKTQERLWRELQEKLEKIQPGIIENI